MSTRNEKIAAWAKANPCSSMEDIGDYYGISKQRVHQILVRQGVHKLNAQVANAAPKPRCDACGKECLWLRYNAQGDYRCMPCRRRLSLIDVVCSLCGILFKRARAFVYRSSSHSQYTFGFIVCPPCEPKRRAAMGRALGQLPVGKSGLRESNPELFKRYYLQELEQV